MPSRAVAAALALLTTGTVLASGGLATAPARAAGGPATSVTVFLAPPDAAALESLAAEPLTSRAERLVRLAPLVPSAAQHAEVAAALADRGFQVTAETTWSITAAAPASAVTDTFGTRPVAGPDASAAQLRAAAGPLSRVPAVLSGLVTAAYPTTGGPAAFHHQATGALTGPDVRNADAAAGGTPSTGQSDGAETVATVQLSTWASSDLTQYAANHGLPDPVGSGQYQAETVDGGPANARGAVEVDLDQQSILSTAPSARQLAFFAPNTNAGFNDAFAAAYDDVTQAAGAVHPDPSITALSVSWGACEPSTGSASITSLEPILQSLVAAGVTVFASSGDDGIYDCGTSTVAVDYPASSPSVLAVGGTRLSAGTSAPNTGSNWTETAWSCTTTTSCHQAGGSGGGISSRFARPSWQTAYVTSAPFAAAPRRLVPDIAAAGDPATGFEIYHQGSTEVYGGTSLAAPLSAAQLANLLGDNGRSTGLGDIHAALYQAGADTGCLATTDPAKAFRDVTVGSNGATADAGSDPSVTAAAGYDTVTGLGGVLWPALTPYLLGGPTVSPTCPPGSTTPPVTPPTDPPVSPTGGTTGTTTGSAGSVASTGHLRLRTVGRGEHQHRVVVATWRTTATGGTVTGATVRLVRAGGTRYAGTTPSGTARVHARPGRYTLTVTSTDSGGHVATIVCHLQVRRPRHHAG